MFSYPPNYPSDPTTGVLVAHEDATMQEWRMASINPNECLAVTGDFIPYGTAVEFTLIPIPGSDYQYYIQSVNPPNFYLYVENYMENSLSFVEDIPPPNGNNSAIFKLEIDSDYYRIKLNVSPANQYITLTNQSQGTDLKVQVKSGGKGKTQKWKFVKGGTDDTDKD